MTVTDGRAKGAAAASRSAQAADSTTRQQKTVKNRGALKKDAFIHTIQVHNFPKSITLIALLATPLFRGGNMAVISLTSIDDQNIYSGSQITSDLFGVNLLFDRDRFGSEISSDGPGENFGTAISELGSQTIRYPGGAISESLFDLFDPNGIHQNNTFGDSSNMFDPDGSGPIAPTTLGLDEVLTDAAAAGLSMTFVMPTYRFLGGNTDSDGNRFEAVDQQVVYDFTTQLLTDALANGVPIQAIEIGNEWWIHKPDMLNAAMNAVEYGRVASRLSMVVQNAITDFAEFNGLPVNWSEPEILIQVGPGGEAEWVMPNGHIPAYGYSGQLVQSTELIFNEFNLVREQRAVDGVLTHRYLTGSYDNINGWAYSPFDTWDNLAEGNSNFGDMSQYVTEWNVSARNMAETGLLQASSLIALFSELVEAGVDHANIWAVQQNNGTALTNNSGAAGEAWTGLSIAGEMFHMMNESLQGLQAIPLMKGTETLGVRAFGNDDQVVMFISNRFGEAQTVEVDVSNLLGTYTHLWGTVIGVGDGNPLDANSAPIIENLTAEQLVSEGIVTFQLDPYETIRLEFTLGNVISVTADSPNPALHNADLHFTGPDGSVTTIKADSSGIFTFDVPPASGTHLDITRDLAAGDPAITAIDALRVLQLAVGLPSTGLPPLPEDFIAADINRDGKVTSQDALEVLRHAVGLPTSHPSQWIFLDPAADFSGVDRNHVPQDSGIMLNGLDGPFDISMTAILLGNMDAIG